jgi:GNAT superfamily N-acetyltransferase
MIDAPTIRPARGDELEAILAMQRRSLRAGGAEKVDRGLMEAALAQMGTMDPRLIGDGTYLVAELSGVIAGSIGWTMRQPLFWRLMRPSLPPLPPLGGGVRNIYVDPPFTGHGLARRLMEAAELQLAAAGLLTAELVTPPYAVPLYQMLGFRLAGEHVVELAGGFEFPLSRMERSLVTRPDLAVSRDSPPARGPASGAAPARAASPW